MKAKPVVMISSTARDLPRHRGKVMDACQRLSMEPKMMEHLPASPDDAVTASLGMVDEADVYLGVIAFRYGHVPEGHAKSITEMEYDRAVERGIPRLIFLMDPEHEITIAEVERGEGGARLDAFRARLQKEQGPGFFKNPDDLRAQALHSLGEVRRRLEAARTDEAGQPTAKALAASLHYVSAIPRPPEAYVAHPYTLLQVHGLIGRSAELELLTDWVTGKRFADVRVFNVVAIGGMGKSALTWTWFHEVAPQEMKPLAGRLWWSFYESDATYENFVTRALAYVSRRPLEEVAKQPFPEQEDLLLRILDCEPFLLVLDGLERILTAYARQDAAFLRDGDLDEETENRVAGALGLPPSAGPSFVGRHRLRLAADPRAGRFLRRLAGVRASRVLASTRLYPAELQTNTGSPLPGCAARFLPGLSDQDALALWRAYGSRGSREAMLPVFRTFDSHPLLIQLLAAEVAEFRDAPGDFDAWKAVNPDFDPFGMPLANVQSHVLAYAMRGLSVAERRTLHVIAGFRMPASMDTVKALLIHADADDDPARKPCATLGELDAALTALEDRGLLGWDRRANRYDLHPIVRGVVWSGLDAAARADLYGTLRTHFAAMPMIEDWEEVESLDDLTPAIELYNSLIGLERYDEALKVFGDRLDKATLYRLSASRLRVDLLEKLFPDGLDTLPWLSVARAQSYALNELALSYKLSGQPGAAVLRFRLADEIDVREGDRHNHSTDLYNLSDTLRLSGNLRAAETSARAALIITRELGDRFREGVTLQSIGLALAARGASAEAATAWRRSLRIFQEQKTRQGEGLVHAYLAEAALQQGDAAAARPLAARAWELAGVQRLARDFTRAARLQGTAALYLDDFATAGELLHHALQRARAISNVEDELPTLVALAEWHRRQGEPEKARELLENVWDAAERGPYPLFHADVLNVLAQIERDAGNPGAAVAAAMKAYRLAWCDGPPFAYRRGLEQARAHLAALGAPEPELSPFDESQHEPLPEVEIDPPDEFGGEG